MCRPSANLGLFVPFQNFTEQSGMTITHMKKTTIHDFNNHVQVIKMENLRQKVHIEESVMNFLCVFRAPNEEGEKEWGT